MKEYIEQRVDDLEEKIYDLENKLSILLDREEKIIYLFGIKKGEISLIAVFDNKDFVKTYLNNHKINSKKRFKKNSFLNNYERLLITENFYPPGTLLNPVE